MTESRGLIGTPVAAVIGADLEGIGKEICNEIYSEGMTDTLLKNLAVRTNGLKYYDAGQEKAYQALADVMINEILLNRRNVENEEELVRKMAEEADVEIIGDIPRDKAVQIYENKNQTVIEGDITLPISQTIMGIAKKLIDG